MNQQTSNFMSNMLNLLSNSSNFNTANFDRLIKAIENVAKAIELLPENLARVLNCNYNQNNVNVPLHENNKFYYPDKNIDNNKKTYFVPINNPTVSENNIQQANLEYSSVVASNIPIAKTSIPNKTQNYNISATKPNSEMNPYMQELARLKNQRNDSFYKMARNEFIANMYECQLNSPSPKIPKKFAPTLNKFDSKDIRKHKIKLALQSVENNITEMRIHQNIHLNRLQKFEKEIESHLQKTENNAQRQKLINDYKSIVNRHERKTLEKLKSKYEFTVSNFYFLKTDDIDSHSVTQNITTEKSQINNEKEDTDIDDVTISQPETHHFSKSNNGILSNANLKRRASPELSITSDDEITEAFPILRSSRSLSQISLPMPKNSRTSKPSCKMKNLTQL